MEGTLWYICKYCGRAYREGQSLVEHKKTSHNLEYLRDRQSNKERKLEKKRKLSNDDPINSQTSPVINFSNNIDTTFAQLQQQSTINGNSIPISTTKATKIKGQEEDVDAARNFVSSSSTKIINNCVPPLPAIKNNRRPSSSSGVSTKGNSTSSSSSSSSASDLLLSSGKKKSCEQVKLYKYQGSPSKIKSSSPTKIVKYSKPIILPSSSAEYISRRIINGKKVYSCNFCQKTYPTSSHAIMHVTVHTGEKRYRCRFCLKAFTNGTNGKSHERSHTGEKPYNCKSCPEKFGSWLRRREHQMKVHRINSQPKKQKIVSKDDDDDELPPLLEPEVQIEQQQQIEEEQQQENVVPPLPPAQKGQLNEKILCGISIFICSCQQIFNNESLAREHVETCFSHDVVQEMANIIQLEEVKKFEEKFGKPNSNQRKWINPRSICYKKYSPATPALLKIASGSGGDRVKKRKNMIKKKNQKIDIYQFNDL